MRDVVLAGWQTAARLSCGFLVFIAFLVACGQANPSVQERAPTQAAIIIEAPQATEAASPTVSPEPTAVFLTPSPTTSPKSIVPAPTETQAPSPTAPATPTATPNPYLPYTIETLSKRPFGGGALQIIDTLEETETFTRYLITYPSDGLTIYGFMNVPHEGVQFPVALVLHGYIPPSEYETVAYTRRYADALAEEGYFVIHPNLRNFPPSDNSEDFFRVGMATDVLNLIAIIREQSQDPVGTLRRADADNIHLWGHSMGGGIALRVATVNPADYLKGIVLYGAMSGNEQWNYERILEWSGGSRGTFELAASDEMLAEISPIDHLERLQTAVSIHHSDADDIVPFAWAVDLCERLTALNHPVECFTYEGQPHTFRGEVDQLFIRRFIRFFKQY
ncbi:MAG: alpha/beta fold hydrolase [Chloroflexota bacterium]